MSPTTAAIDALREHAHQRSLTARRAIEDAIRALRKGRKPVNVNAVARAAGVTRKTVYKHTDLLERIRTQGKRTRSVDNQTATGDNAIVAALRHELTTQRSRYEAEINQVREQLNDRERSLAAAYSEIHRLRAQQSH
jgi:hypothetical protein